MQSVGRGELIRNKEINIEGGTIIQRTSSTISERKCDSLQISLQNQCTGHMVTD